MAKNKAQPTVKSSYHSNMLLTCFEGKSFSGDIIYMEKNHSKYNNAAFNVKDFLHAIHVCVKIPVPNKL